MDHRRLASASTLATAALFGAFLNAAVAFADPSDSSASDHSKPPSRAAQHEAGSGAQSGHRGTRLPGSGAAQRPTAGAPDVEPAPVPAVGTTTDTVPDLPQVRLAPPSVQRSDGPAPSAVRTVPVAAARVSGGGAQIDDNTGGVPIAPDVPGSGPIAPALQVVHTEPTPSPAAAQPAAVAVTPVAVTPVGQPWPAITVLPAPPTRISAVPAPAAASRIASSRRASARVAPLAGAWIETSSP